jgi:uncharacterized damage-inducible protein DinB
MDLLRQLIVQLKKGYDDDPWYGPSTKSLLDGITASEAALRPAAGVHSIWEIVLHMDGWQREVTRRLQGSVPDIPLEGDWRPLPQITEEAWQKTQAALEESLHELIAALKNLPGAKLEESVGGIRNPEKGTGVSYWAMIAGLSQHNAYHSGQIAILRKTVESLIPR